MNLPAPAVIGEPCTGQLADYGFHGLRIQIQADEPSLAGQLHGRLRQFAAPPGPPADLTFIYRGVEHAGAHWVTAPPPEARPVYEPQIGAVLYADADDSYYITFEERIRVACRPADGLVEVSYLHSELAGQSWYVSHPMLTLPLLELLKRRGYYSLHAASLSVEGRGLLIAGKSGAGKSTLTLGLMLAGFDFLGDDMVFLVREPAGLRMLAFPDEIDVTDETAGLFPELRHLLEQPKTHGWHKRQVWAEQLPGVTLAYQARPAALIFPRIAHTAHSAIEPLAPGAALMELAPNVLLTEAASSRAHLETIAELVRSTACYRLHTGRDLAEAAACLRGVLA